MENTLDTESIFSTVLLVEDETAHASLIVRALKGVVGEVIHVTSGQGAIQALETNFIELVLSDLHLPDSTGIDLLQKIEAARPNLPVIVMTSSNNLDNAVEAMRSGAWDYMVKQFSEDFQSRLGLVITRNAERRMQQLREQEVRAERNAFWAAANAAQDGLAILGSEGLIVFANETFRQLTSGLAHVEGSNIVDLVAYYDYQVARDLYENLRAGEVLWSSEFQVYDGETRKETKAFEMTLSSVAFGSVSGIGTIPDMRRSVVWVRDITRKREQEKFQRDLLSTTSHDLKGPLGAILSSAELLQDGMLSEDKIPQMITRIASCARNSISIIDELLSARRIQDGVLVVNPRWYEVAEILEDAHLDYFPVAKAKSIEFLCKPIADGLKIFADRIALGRVLGNFISNALKFTPSEGLVELSAVAGGGGVTLHIRDTGQGIEPNSRHLLFERYSRLEKHQQIDGTGLGLFVAKNIVDAHGGRIQVRSQVGSGTTFSVFLPDGVER